jgi:hypothetical protein
MKIVVALLFLAILASLGSALFFMMRRGDGDATEADADARRGRRMARALALRVALSIGLLACLLLAWKLGYIHPSGLPVTAH